MPTEEKPQRQIKFLLSEEDQNVIRLAAALSGTTMADYAREVVLQDARELTKDIKLPAGRRKRKGSG